jgi:hypothetical protein
LNGKCNTPESSDRVFLAREGGGVLWGGFQVWIQRGFQVWIQNPGPGQGLALAVRFTLLTT